MEPLMMIKLLKNFLLDLQKRHEYFEKEVSTEKNLIMSVEDEEKFKKHTKCKCESELVSNDRV